MTGIYIRERRDPLRVTLIKFIEPLEKEERKGWRITRTSTRWNIILKEWMSEEDAVNFKSKRRELTEAEITKMLLTGEISAKFI